MSNPARDLLNYVDEHKTEMKDDTYKGIVDRLAPIHKTYNDIKTSLYRAIYMVSDLDDTDEDGGDVCMLKREFKVYLTETEVNLINEKLIFLGSVSSLHHHFNLSLLGF